MDDNKLKEYREFTKILDDKAQSSWKMVQMCIKDCPVDIHSYDFSIIVDEDSLKKFGLNDDIDFLINYNGEGGQTSYYYKKMEINPDCYYVRPDDYHEVTTLQMLQEAIRQDTNQPDIKYLEDGEKQKI